MPGTMCVKQVVQQLAVRRAVNLKEGYNILEIRNPREFWKVKLKLNRSIK